MSESIRTVPIEIFFYSIILLGMVLAVMLIRQDQRSKSRRMFIYLLASSLMMVILETVVISVDGKPGRFAAWLNHGANFILHALPTLPVSFWLGYLEIHLEDDMDMSTRAKIRYIPVFISIVLMVISTFTGILYVIDEFNRVHVSSTINIVFGLNGYYVISAIILIVKSRELLEQTVRYSYFAFILMPVMAALIQVFNPHLRLVWNSVALALVIFFYFVEVQDNTKDFLTGLPNRRKGDDWIDKRISRFASAGGFGLIVIDLDDFKSINDQFGHVEGDLALRMFSRVLAGAIKRDDKVFRFAGDEFLVILDNVSEPVISNIIERIGNHLEQFNNRITKPYSLSFSAGFAIYDPKRHSSKREFLHEADEKMYESKRIKKEAVKGR